MAERMPGYRYYCKSDDDTLVHLDHLTALVDELDRSLPGTPASCKRRPAGATARSPWPLLGLALSLGAWPRCALAARR